MVIGRKGEYYQLFYDFLNLGYSEAQIDGKKRSLHEKIILSRYKKHDIDIVIDKILDDGELENESRLIEAVENAIQYSKGLVKIRIERENQPPLAKASPDAKALEDKSGGKKIKEEFLLSSLWTCPKDSFAFPEVEPRLFSFNSPYGACEDCYGLGRLDVYSKKICPTCEGKRLKPEALSVKISDCHLQRDTAGAGGKNISEITEMTISDVYDFFVKYESNLEKNKLDIVKNLLDEIIDRLSFLLEVGLDYITLNRESGTLSGGEAQRIRLASQIGSQLSNALYVLDEPTIGLHPRDTDKLIGTLKSLKKLGNSVIVVEHDEQTIFESDYLVDLGPLAGVDGGKVVAEGEIKKLLKCRHSECNEGSSPKGVEFASLDSSPNAQNDKLLFPESLTLKYLRNEKKIALPEKRRSKITESLKIQSASANNIKNLFIDIPLRKLVGLTGVSGSGKSTLLYDILYKNINLIKDRKKTKGVKDILGTEYIDRVVMVNQSPIGRTPRSNPATYTGVFTPIREFFASLEESRAKGYLPSRFSFNVVGGRCEACNGAGYNLIEMHFLPPVLAKCEICNGKRFSRETLNVKYKKKNIAEVLEMTIEEAHDFFKENYKIAEKLKVLKDVGLGYLQLGQFATTLSGGEAQRIKLAKELIMPLGKHVLYLLDEPTVGLHYHDVEMLLHVLNKLIDRGNSMIVIEHNMHIIKSCDYLIDLGPEGGDGGGKVVAKGLPEVVANDPNSETGKYLKSYL